MRMTKKVQNGLLLTLYICRSGRARLEDVAEELEVSQHFMEQVARKLRVEGVLKSVRGPGGGYELEGEPTVGQVFAALDPIQFIAPGDSYRFRFGPHEYRALDQLSNNMKSSLSVLMNRKVRNIGQELVVTEIAMLDRPYLGQLTEGN